MTNRQDMLKNIFNAMDTYIFLGDLNTDDLIFINDKMIQDYGLDKDTVMGKKCWQVLQTGQTGRCAWCKKDMLTAENGKSVVWKENNAVAGMTVNKIDSMIDWPGVGKVHFQQSSDMANRNHSKEALSVLKNSAITLLSHNNENFADVMTEGIDLISEIANINRLSIFCNTETPGGIRVSQIYRWGIAQGGTTDTRETLNNTTYEEMAPGWYNILSGGQMINSPIHLVLESGILTTFNCRSVLAVPVIMAGKFWGFVYFEDYSTDRYFTVFEVDILRSASVMLANVVIRNAMEENLKKALADARTASLAKSEFLSHMSHEMRTPLNAIIGMTAIGRSSDAIEKKDYAFDRIVNASNHLLGVINDILDMSKIEANKLDLAAAEFSFEKTVQKVVDVISFRVDEKRQRLTVIIDPHMPAALVGDDLRLSQVIANLLSNAVKFTPMGGEITLKADVLSEAYPICRLRVCVEDNGIGLTNEQKDRVFNSFEQAETGTSRKYGGTGLGLAISQRVVQLMGGEIWVESEAGQGARFIFTVNLGRGAGGDAGADNPAEEEDGGGTDFSGCTVLLAEDVEINREIIYTLMEPMGLEIIAAENGAQAFEMFERNPGRFNAILMDVQMPVMDGFEATRQIRALGTPEAAAVPIIAMTANVFREDIERCLDAGMNAHIGKPVSIPDVVKVLKGFFQA